MKKILLSTTLIIFALFALNTQYVGAWGSSGGCCGGDFGFDGWDGGYDGGGPDLPDTPDKPTPPPAPTCSINATPKSLEYDGSSTLVWSSSNAVSASINEGVGSVSLNGSLTVSNLKSSKTFKMTVKNSTGKSASCSVKISVAPKPPAPSCSISANPSSVLYGANTTLSWTSSNASEAQLGGVGSVALNGSYTVSNIVSNTDYVLTVKGKGGTSSCRAKVYVHTPTLSCNIYLSPNPTANGNSTLYWSTNGADWVILSDGSSNYNVAKSGERSVSLPAGERSRTYTLTVGNAWRQSTCKATLTSSTPIAPTCSLYANKNHIKRGEAVTLSWTSSNATSAIFADNGSVSLSGSRIVYPQSSGNYKLIVSNSNGDQYSCNTYINVSQSVPNITVSSIPYTGPNDLLYVAIMGTLFMLSSATLYTRRRKIMELLQGK